MSCLRSCDIVFNPPIFLTWRSGDEMKLVRLWMWSRAVGDVSSRLEPAVLRKAQDHHRSGRRRPRRNRSAVDPVADPVAANGSARRDRGDRRRLAQRRSRAHAAHARNHRTHRHSGRGGSRVSAGAAQRRRPNCGSSSTAPYRGWARGLRGAITRRISWAKCRRASPPPNRWTKTPRIFWCAWSENIRTRSRSTTAAR